MRDASESLGQFKPVGTTRVTGSEAVQVEEVESIGVAPTVYREEDMTALEAGEPSRASV
jgi:hypothetical protein